MVANPFRNCTESCRQKTFDQPPISSPRHWPMFEHGLVPPLELGVITFEHPSIAWPGGSLADWRIATLGCAPGRRTPILEAAEGMLHPP